MRVGLDCWGLGGSARRTGMGQYTAQLLDGLPDEGVDVVAFGGPDEARPSWLRPEIDWRTLGARGPRRLAAVESRLLGLPPAVCRAGLDLFHFPGLHVRPSFPPVPRLACPLVVTVHDAIPLTHYGKSLPLRNRAYWRWNLRRARSADRIVTVSEHARAEITAATGLPPEHVDVIPNGVAFSRNADPTVLSRLGVTPPYVFAAGSFEPRKNLSGVLAAFDRVAADHPDWSMVALVDPGSGHAPAGMALREALAAGDRVTFVSDLSRSDLEALYTGAAAVTFCSWAEGFGYPVLEALACGTPLVISHLPVLVALAGGLAVAVDPGDPASIAAGIVRAVTDERYRRRVAAHGPERAAEFPPSRCTVAHVALYAAALEGRVRAAR